mmetsp:Transcript_17383/g.24373  ORF Transcript_17383/g.24373 Transcript_17383/m.24373 type:complete len:209 (+) Transcript_17383:213-839(+)
MEVQILPDSCISDRNVSLRLRFFLVRSILGFFPPRQQPIVNGHIPRIPLCSNSTVSCFAQKSRMFLQLSFLHSTSIRTDSTWREKFPSEVDGRSICVKLRLRVFVAAAKCKGVDTVFGDNRSQLRNHGFTQQILELELVRGDGVVVKHSEFQVVVRILQFQREQQVLWEHRIGGIFQLDGPCDLLAISVHGHHWVAPGSQEIPVVSLR